MPTDLLILFSPQNIIVFMLVFTRLNGLMTSAPLFSTYPIPIQVKIWLTAAIAFIIYPSVLNASTFAVPTNMPTLMVYMLKEFMVGYLIGFVANFLFVGVRMAGQFISVQMGLSIANAMDPSSGEQTPVIGQIYTYMLTIIFLLLGAHQWLFLGLHRSFVTIAPGLEFLFSASLVEQILKMSAEMFVIAVSLALPIFCVLFIKDVLLGVVAKMIPNMNIFMVAMPLKVLIGVFLLTMFIFPTGDYMINLIQNYFQRTLQIFAGGL